MLVTEPLSTAQLASIGWPNRPASFEKLASHFFTTFPQLEGVRFSHCWGALDRADHREGRRGLFLRGLDAMGLGFDS